MEIIDGKLFDNKTFRYLYPCLKHYGQIFREKINSVFKLAIGIGDMVSESKYGNKPCIYILISTFIPTMSGPDNVEYGKKVDEIVKWFREQHYYVDDYLYDIINANSNRILVLEIPEIYRDSYYHFIRGKYSKMYSTEDIDKFYNKVVRKNKELEKKINDRVEYSKKVLLKDESILPDFVSKLNKEFGTKMTEPEMKGTELDFPLTMEEEIFSFELCQKE